MDVSLAEVIRAPHLSLRVLAPGTTPTADVPVEWAHGTDLHDPTPFLAPCHLVLTTGPRGVRGTEAWDAYVARLRAAGVAAVGFGVGVLRSSTPAPLVRACVSQGLPLLEVPQEVPFIAVSRFVADRRTAADRARDARTLGALRAVSLAALRPDGLHGVLSELSRQTGSAVLLSDTRGRVSVSTGPVVPAACVAAVEREAVRLLRRGRRSGSRLVTGDREVSLQTVGRKDGLLGVVATVGATPPTTTDRALTVSAVALVGLALEQQRSTAGARRALHAAVVQDLLAGNVTVGHRVLHELGDVLPREPVALARLQVPEPARSRVSSALDGDLVGTDGDQLVVVGSADGLDTRVAAAVSAHDGRGGVSSPGRWTDLAGRCSREAVRALHHSSGDEPVARFDLMTGRGIGWVTGLAGADDHARTALSPLLLQEDADTLLLDLSTWLACHGQWDVAARRLGIHRHTLRRRITRVGTVLGRDLASMDARAELWVSLRALDTPRRMTHITSG